MAAAFLVQTARSLRVPASENKLFEVAIVEALNNALKHGSQDPDDSLICELELAGRCLKIRVLDRAAKLPLALALPGAAAPRAELTSEEWQTVRESRYGLHLIAAVFPGLRPVTRGEHQGIEMELNF